MVPLRSITMKEKERNERKKAKLNYTSKV